MSESMFKDEVDINFEEKGKAILRSEFYYALIGFHHKKAVVIDEVPAELLQSLEKRGIVYTS